MKKNRKENEPFYKRQLTYTYPKQKLSSSSENEGQISEDK